MEKNLRVERNNANTLADPGSDRSLTILWARMIMAKKSEIAIIILRSNLNKKV